MTFLDPSQQVFSYRRYCLLECHAARRRCDIAVANVFLGKQQAEPGTSLAADFPDKAALALGGYTTVEDLRGADLCELECEAHLSKKQAQAVLSALAAL